MYGQAREHKKKHLLMECILNGRKSKAICCIITKTVAVKSLLNPTENQSKTVKAVLEFIAATGLDLRE